MREEEYVDKIFFISTEVVMIKGHFIDVAKIIHGQMTDRMIALAFMGGGELIFENADWEGEIVEPAVGYQLRDPEFKVLASYLKERLKPTEIWP